MKPYAIITAAALFMLSMLFAGDAPPAYAAKTKTKKTSAQPAQEQAAEEDEEAALAPRPRAQTIAKAPYIGAILVDAATGKVLFEDNADARGYPASVIKLMNLLIILDGVRAKSISLEDKITVTAAASKIGGSQVYLKEYEVFSVEELLYALMVQSANDAAVALALQYAGTTDAFVEMMNRKAQEIGMKNTAFHSVHGLPPGKDQQPDVSTPRDIAKLCIELLKYPEVLRYTGTKERPFRAESQQPFIMRNHNHLLGSVAGCDGFKTGYYRAAGYSVAATATKKGTRAIAVVFGSVERKVRDAKARELLAKGLAELVRALPPPPPVKAVAPIRPAPAEEAQPAVADNGTGKKDVIQISKTTLVRAGIALGVILVLLLVISFIRNTKRKSRMM